MPYFPIAKSEISGFGNSSKTSIVLVLFILLVIVVSTFSPVSTLPAEAPVFEAGSVDFTIVNNTSLGFFMYRFGGDWAQYPSDFTLQPNGGSTTVYVKTSSKSTRVDSYFYAYDPRFGIDPDQAGLIRVTMYYYPGGAFPPRAQFERVEITRPPISPINYRTSGRTLTFNNQ
ncbi:hypothetical protein [Paenibacillus herberti]|uniref:Uncharacterized protein n=1 Tax=Paenibacillus herberti TaxID=1619309 RepID=A0A229NYY5_9BACL|nr:hypothetical protein [Paenibacillus herberti]OXM14869.1 hypothetical protein CGZ75_18560 [Paenibacillus herberti]